MIVKTIIKVFFFVFACIVVLGMIQAVHDYNRRKMLLHLELMEAELGLDAELRKMKSLDPQSKRMAEELERANREARRSFYKTK
jgi:hypothetical protein